MKEIVSVVDENDRVVGRRTRKFVHSSGTLHRVSAVIITDSSGRILMQKRSRRKDVYPECWGLIEGHVRPGESYENTAKRELYEEIGIRCRLEPVDKRRVNRGNDRFFVQYFKCVHNGPFKIQKSEVEFVKFFKPEQIKKMLKSKEKIAPGAKIGLRKILEI